MYIIYPQKRTFMKIFLYINDFCMCAIRPSCVHTGIPGDHKLHILFPHRYILEVCSQKSPKQLVYLFGNKFLVYKYNIFKDTDITLHPSNGISIKHTPSSFFFLHDASDQT